MYKLTLYQMPKSKRWRWKFSYNERVLARADHHYASKAAAHKSFTKLATAAKFGNYTII